MRIYPLGFLVALTVWITIATAAWPSEQCWETPVHRCQSDVAAKEAHDTCAMHKGMAIFWPEPCTSVDKHYSESGAKAKFDEIERLELQNELDQVKGVIEK